jgi:SAM-dependent methyltransferase
VRLPGEIAFLAELLTLARRRTRSRADYFAFQRHQALRVVRSIEAVLKPECRGTAVDLGCGTGGYTSVLAGRWGSVIGVDLQPPLADFPGVRFERASVTEWTCAAPADLVVCASVIEHVSKKQALVANIRRNLRPGGGLYLSFPPFLSFGGGHQLKPLHYLPESVAICIGKRRGSIGPDVTGYANLFGDWGLYRTSISGVRRLLLRGGFRIVECRARFLGLNTTRLPVFADLVTWHAEFYCVRE